MWPNANASDEPSSRERMYDLPERQGPHMDNTPTGRLILFNNSSVSGTMFRAVRCVPWSIRSSLERMSYLPLFGMIRGMEEGSPLWLRAPGRESFVLVNDRRVDILIGVLPEFAVECAVAQMPYKDRVKSIL